MAFGSNNNGGNNNVDDIFKSASSLEQRINSISDSIDKLAQTADSVVRTISSAIRESGDLVGQVGISANSNLENVKSGIKDLSDYLKLAKDYTADINDTSKFNEAQQNFQLLTQAYEQINTKVGETASNLKELWDKLKQSPEAVNGSINDLDNFANTLKDIFNGLSKTVDELPQSVKSNFEQIKTSFQEVSGVVEQVSKETAKHLTEMFNSIPKGEDGSQYFKALNDSIQKLSETAGTSTTNIVRLLEGIGAGADNGKELANIYGEIAQAMKAFEHTKFSDITDNDAIQKQYEMLEKIKDFQSQLGNSLDQNLNKLSVDKALQISQVMQNIGKQMETMYSFIDSLDKSTSGSYANIFGASNFQDIGKQAYIDAYKQSVTGAVNSGIDVNGVYSTHLERELSNTRKHGNEVQYNAQTLEEKANLLVAQQMAGVNFGFNANEIAEKAQKIQGNADKQVKVQSQIEKALISGNKDLLPELYPQLVQLQREINFESLGLSKFLPTKEQLKDLPGDVQETIAEIQKVIKSAQQGNSNMISIGVSIPREAGSDIDKAIRQLTNLNDQFKQTQQQLNQTSSSFENMTNKALNVGSWFGNTANRGLGLMGLGGMLSATKIVGDVMGTHRSQGGLETNLALAELMGYGGYDDVARNQRYEELMNLGIGDSLSTHGLIQSQDYAKSFMNMTSNIQGNVYGLNDVAGMREFAETSVLLQKGLGASESTINQGINTFYKELKMNATEVNMELLKMGQTAEAVNIPFDKYVQQVSSLAMNLKNIGIDGRNASDILATLIQGGMSNETAMYYAQSVGSSISNMSPGMMAYSGVMSGQYGNFYDAVAGGQMLWNSDGTVDQNNIDKLARSFGWYGDMMSGAFGGAGHDMIMMQVLQGQLGMDKRAASMSVNMMNEGKSLSEIVSMYESKEGVFSDVSSSELTKSQDALKTSIEKASENLSGIEKSLQAYNTSVERLAFTNENLLRKATDFSGVINNVGNSLSELTGKLGENTAALYALLAVMAIGPGNIAKGASKLFTLGKGKLVGGAAGRAAAGRVGGTVATEVAEAGLRGGAARGLSGLAGKIKLPGILGLGLAGLGALTLFSDSGSNNQVPDSSLGMMTNSLGGLSASGASMGAFDQGFNSGQYSNIDQYAIDSSALGGNGERALKNLSRGVLFGASFIPLIGWGAAGLSVAGEMGGYDALFGSSDSDIINKYGSNYKSTADKYKDYVYQNTGGSEVEEVFSLIAAKAIQENAGGVLLGKTTDQQMEFGTEYAKAIAQGKDSIDALMIAERALAGNKNLEEINKQNVQTAILNLTEAKASGKDINEILKSEMPKNAQETQKVLKDISNATGIKIDELITAIESQGITAAQLAAQMKLDGTAKTAEESAKNPTSKAENDYDRNVKKLLTEDPRLAGVLSKKDRDTAMEMYLANRTMLQGSGMGVAGLIEWLKNSVEESNAGKSNSEIVSSSNKKAANFQAGLNILNKSGFDKTIDEIWENPKYKKKYGELWFQGSEEYITALSKQTGIPVEAIKKYAEDKGISSGKLEGGIRFLSDDAMKGGGFSNNNPDVDMLAATFGDVGAQQKKELEELNDNQKKAVDALNKIANNTSTPATSASGYANGSVDASGHSMGSYLTGGILEKAITLIGANEGSPSSVNANDNGAMSIGKVQWHGSRAKGLLNQIYNENPSLFNNPALSGIVSDLSKSNSYWDHRVASGSEAAALKKVLSSQTSVDIQNQLSKNDVAGYLEHTRKKYGVTDENTLLMAADIINQGGYGGFDKLANAIKASGRPITMETLDQFARNSRTAIKDPNRRNRTLQSITGGITPSSSSSTGTPDSDIIGDLSSTYYGSDSTAFGPIDAGIGINNPYLGSGAVNAKTKYASNLYGRGYQTLASGMYNTQELSQAAGTAAKKIEHKVDVDVKADKVFSDPAIAKDIKNAVEQVMIKHGQKLKAEVASELEKMIAARYG